MKWNIQKRLLVLVLAAGILSFLTMSGLSFYGMSVTRKEMTDLGDELGRAGANFTEKVFMHQIKQTLGELAESRAEFIEQETDSIIQDVQLLSKTMTDICKNPNSYKPVTLPDPRKDKIGKGETYVTYCPDLLKNGTSPELQREIEIAGNIRTIMMPIAKSFASYKSSFFVGSSKGYFFGIDVNPRQMGDTVIPEEEIYYFDCRLRPWYKNAVDAGGIAFSDLYTDINNDEYQFISCSMPYYDNNGVAGVVGMDLANKDIYETINETVIGKNGFSFVLNDKGHVIFSSRTSGELAAVAGNGDLRKSSEKTLADAAKKMVDGEGGILPVFVDGDEYFLAFAPLKNRGWSFATLTLRKDVDAAAETSQKYFLAQINGFSSRLQDKYFYITFFAGLLGLGLLHLLFNASKNLSHRLVRPIHVLSEGVREIAQGNLDKKIDIRTGDETEDLANSFNAMTDDLKNYMANLTKVTAEKEHIATELDVASEIQRGMLPKDFPTRDDFELFATMTPAKEVGGDFYDFYFIDETHLAVTVADVSGKGISAALFMVIAKTILNNFAVSTHNREGLAEVVAAANDKLCANNDAMMFVTVFIGVLDLETGEFVYVNGGHNPPVIYHAEENRCEFLDVKKNFVLGPMDGIPFIEQRITFKRGDLIFMYTDGVTEALNVADEEYLPERLIDFMNSTDCRADLQTLLKNVRGDVSKHVGEAEQSDDITMFALRFKGTTK